MILNVMYSCNNQYIIQAAVSMISLFENNRDFQEINIYFIEDNLSESDKDLLRKVTYDYNRQIYLYSLTQICNGLHLNTKARHPNTIYSKIFTGFVTKADKIIYIDCDTIINGSLYELYNEDISDYLIGGVMMPYSNNIKTKLGLNACDAYICDGFVLFNLIKWRKGNIEEKCVDYINKCQGSPLMLSEGTINYVCKGKIKILPPKYNLMSHMILMKRSQIMKLFDVRIYYDEKELSEAKIQPVVIHFLNELYIRPWYINSDHPYKKYYLRYLDYLPQKEALGNGKLSKRTMLTRLLFKILPFSIFNALYHLIKN